MYLPLAQLAADETWPWATLAVKSAGQPPGAPCDQRHGSAPGRSIRGCRSPSGSSPIGSALSVLRERIVALLSAFFGGVATLLAGIGLYGVTSYAVSRSRTEIGVRMALGADAGGVVRLVLRGAAGLLATGVAIGIVASLLAAGLVGSLLYGLEPRDPLTLAVAAASSGGRGAARGRPAGADGLRASTRPRCCARARSSA